MTRSTDNSGEFGQDGLLASLLETSADCIKVIELDGRLSYVNRNGLLSLGANQASDLVGRLWWELWPPASETMIRQAVAEALETGASRFEGFCPTRNGEPRWWDVSVSPVRGDLGQVVRLLAVSRNITQSRATQERLRDSEAKFQAIVNSIDQMIWSTLPDGFHDYYNDRWYEYTGVPQGSTDGEAWNGMFHPDDQARAWEVWRRSLATGEPYHIEYRLRHRSGQYRWVIGRAQCVRDEAGAIVRWFGTCTDVHDLKVAEATRDLIMHELSHRIKNLFAVLSGLVALSARGQTPEVRTFATGLRNRVSALASAHAYVQPDAGNLADNQPVSALLQNLLAPYQTPAEPRIVITGDDVMLDRNASTAIALLVHELATNAVKHGALSQHGGRVDITGQVGTSAFTLTWAECGGPKIHTPPTRIGFGSAMSQSIMETQLGARFDRHWGRDGLVALITIPLDALRDAKILTRLR